MQIDFEDYTQTISKDKIILLQNLLIFTARKENVSQNTEISVVFVDNKKIRQLNREYRNKDQATDVLSFAMQINKESIISNNTDIPVALGDIVISVEKAKEQAEEYHHSFQRELGFLIVHGFLHLLGYDHNTQVEEEKMFQRQKEILKEFGLER